MKKGILSLLAWSLPFILMAQNNASMQSILTKEGPRMEEEKGIKWITGLSWKQIKQKAKAENKYIFIDAYTTWCGPCKMMDKYVYLNDTVSDFFNEHFIAVKAQMDKTDQDDEVIKDWYNDAEQIQRDYAVIAYPSLIFLSPESIILYKQEGFRPVQKLVDTAKLVLTNGTVYNDPYKEYKTLVSEYKKGIKLYDRMPYMIRTALKLNEADLAKELFKEHLNLALQLNKTERYTKENIEVWSSFILKPGSKALQFFLKDGGKIDQIMNQKGYSRGVVDMTIQVRIVDSFFRMQKGETVAITGVKVPNSEVMFMRLPVRKDGKIEPDYVEADWKKLKKMIRKNFSKVWIERNVLKAKTRWYQQHQNMEAASKVKLIQIEKDPPSDIESAAYYINDAIGWPTFLYVTDGKLLEKAVQWVAKLIAKASTNDVYLDTYANLLYKLGRTEEAIQWEQKALSVTNPKNESQKKIYRNVIEKMKKGEPTYLEEGAIWMKE